MQTIHFVKHCCSQNTALTGDGREGKLPCNTLYPYSESIILNAGKVGSETSLPSGCLSMFSLTTPISILFMDWRVYMGLAHHFTDFSCICGNSSLLTIDCLFATEVILAMRLIHICKEKWNPERSLQSRVTVVHKFRKTPAAENNSNMSPNSKGKKYPSD